MRFLVPAKPKSDAMVANPSPISPALECLWPVWGNATSSVVAASTLPDSLFSTVSTLLIVVSGESCSGRIGASFVDSIGVSTWAGTFGPSGSTGSFGSFGSTISLL